MLVSFVACRRRPRQLKVSWRKVLVWRVNGHGTEKEHSSLVLCRARSEARSGSVGRRGVETSWQALPRAHQSQERLHAAEERLAPASAARAEIAQEGQASLARVEAAQESRDDEQR